MIAQAARIKRVQRHQVHDSQMVGVLVQVGVTRARKTKCVKCKYDSARCQSVARHCVLPRVYSMPGHIAEERTCNNIVLGGAELDERQQACCKTWSTMGESYDMRESAV